jgi:hypothetical protein
MTRARLTSTLDDRSRRSWRVIQAMEYSHAVFQIFEGGLKVRNLL